MWNLRSLFFFLQAKKSVCSNLLKQILFSQPLVATFNIDWKSSEWGQCAKTKHDLSSFNCLCILRTFFVCLQINTDESSFYKAKIAHLPDFVLEEESPRRLTLYAEALRFRTLKTVEHKLWGPRGICAELNLESRLLSFCLFVLQMDCGGRKQ